MKKGKCHGGGGDYYVSGLDPILGRKQWAKEFAWFGHDS
jgi:hypothetical protein